MIAAWMQGLNPIPLAVFSISIGIDEEQRDAPPGYDSFEMNKTSGCFSWKTEKGFPGVKHQVCLLGGGRGMLRHSRC